MRTISVNTIKKIVDMSYFIGPDGRLMSFDAEIKADGSVRPRNYHDFAEGNLVSQSEQEGVAQRTHDEYLTAPGQRKEKPRNITPISKLSKNNKALYKSEIRAIINLSLMSSSAADFVRARAMALTPIRICSKLNRKICDAALDYEMDEIINVIKQVNSVIAKFASISNASNRQSDRKKKPTPQPNFLTNASHKDVLPSQSRRLTYVAESQPRITQHTNNTQYVRSGRLPKYGYARDYFGRVQERDSYREDRPVNPYSSLSSYDKEDDNESLDII